MLAALLVSAPAVAQPAPAPLALAQAGPDPAAAPLPGTPPAASRSANPRAGSSPAQPRHHTKGDPWEGFNRKIYKFHASLDKIIFRPAALGYRSIIPKFLRTGIRHILSNLTEPIVFLNDVLQLKPKRAIRTFARFIINSTAGIGGALDIAKTARLPHRNNGFGNTLARYGVGPGPYLFLPFIGPTDLRDLLGGQADAVVLPASIGKPFNRFDYQVSTFVIAGLDLRAENDTGLKALLTGAADPYATLRSVYQQSRAAEIDDIKGKSATTGLEDPLVDPADTPGDPVAEPMPGAAEGSATPLVAQPPVPPAPPTPANGVDQGATAAPDAPAATPPPADAHAPNPPPRTLAMFTL